MLGGTSYFDVGHRHCSIYLYVEQGLEDDMESIVTSTALF